jgi:hypothetical protein
MKEDEINDAINQYMKLLWWTDESKHGIIARYGEDIWLSIHGEVVKKINSVYPFLIGDSVIKIANIAAYFWK